MILTVEQVDRAGGEKYFWFYNISQKNLKYLKEIIDL